jgi:flavin-dependent dehydrogenase
MIKNLTRILVAGAALSLCACSGPGLSQREKGALAGGTLGAGLGAIVGHETGHTGGGIAIGAATGALAGGLIGNESDRIEGAQSGQDERLRRQEEQILRQQRELEELRRQQNRDRYGQPAYPDRRPSSSDSYDSRY